MDSSSNSNSTSNSTILAGALEYWKELNLTDTLRELDSASLEIVDNQKTSLQERSKLSKRTKEFRAVPDADKLNEFKPLLRAYQNEIDALTKRMKFAENGFLKLFKSLSDAPDPHPLLESLIEEHKKSGQNKGVEKEQLAELQTKCTALQLETARLKTKAQMADQLQQQVDKLESSIETRVREQVGEREREIREQNEDLVRHLKDREGDLQRQLATATRKLEQIQTSHDSQEAERVEQSMTSDRELIGKLAELDIMQSDLDHANGRVTDLQTQNAKLRAELSSITGENSSAGPGGGVAETLADYRRRVGELEEETARLFENLEKAESELAAKNHESANVMGAIRGEARGKDEELQRLRSELKRRADYDELKRDLDIMKSVEFSVSNDWGMGEEEDAEEKREEKEEEESLEKLLVRRNKSLENQLIDSRNQLNQCKGSLKEAETQCQRLSDGLADKTKLAEQLEADLLNIRQPTSTNETEEEAADSVELKTMADSHHLLDIVTGQRDRFRQRNIELEEELRAKGSSTNELQRQVDQVKQDNLRLYEEIKYLRSSYSSSSGSSNSHQAPVRSDTAVVTIPSKFDNRKNVDMDTGVAAKYKGMYEESLNPFNAFHRRESTRRVRSMGVVDRVIYKLSNMVMGSPRARMVMLVYAGLLHLLVIAVLYRLA